MDENICQMKTMKVDIATDTGLGTLTYENASGVHTLSFGLVITPSVSSRTMI